LVGIMKPAALALFLCLLGAWGAMARSSAIADERPGQKPPPAVNVAAVMEKIKAGERLEKIEALGKLERAALDKQLGDHKAAAIELCARLLRDEDADVANAAGEVLSWLDADAVPLLVVALQSDNADAQSRAASALSSIASRSRPPSDKLDAAVPHLAKLLDGGAKSARHNAFYALSEMGPRAIPYMIDALDAEEYFQWVLMRGFVRHGEQSVEPLCIALRTGDAATRRNAAFMLFHISWRAPEVLPVLESKALGPLIAAIDDGDPLARSRAIDTLGRMKGRAKPALDRLIATLKQPDAPLLSIADAVGRIGPEAKHLDELFDAVERIRPESTNERERAAAKFGAAIAAVGETGVDRVIRALDDRREMARNTAMHALWNLGPQAAPAVPAIVEKLNEGNDFAPHVLGAIGPKAEEAIPHLIRRLGHDEWARPRSGFTIMHHSACAQALTAIGPAALPALLEGLKQDDDLVQAGCLAALEELDREAMVPLSAIEPLLRDGHPVVRGLAMRALVKHGEATVVAPLLERLLKDLNPAVARAAKQHLDELARP
jgi:HEAT repeat protein